MKHSVFVQFIRWLCVQIRPKTDNEQLVCNFFSPMFSTTSCHSPVMLMMARKYIAKSSRFSPFFLPILSFLEKFKSWPQIPQITAMLLFFTVTLLRWHICLQYYVQALSSTIKVKLLVPIPPSCSLILCTYLPSGPGKCPQIMGGGVTLYWNGFYMDI